MRCRLEGDLAARPDEAGHARERMIGHARDVA
jgi:hypothetical protein